MKRRLLIIAVCLLLGAVVNVAVAWGCGEWLHRTPVDGGVSRPSSGWALGVPPGWPRPTRKVTASGLGLTVDFLSATTQQAYYAQQISQFGWPFRGLESERHSWSIARVMAWRGLLKPIDPANGPLLIRPIWPGFLANTVFYATVLWLLISCPFTLRRFLRLRRGLCPKCAYPMGGSSVCTECGCGLPKRARTT